MLPQLSWLQFGIVLGGALLLYYLFVLFKYYQDEFKPKPPGAAAAPALAGQIFGDTHDNEEEMHLVDEDELRFGEAEPDEIKTQVLGGIADFMHELNVLLRVVASKEEFFVLLRVLTDKYPDASAIRYAEPIALHILEEGADLPFPLTKDEIENALIPEPHED